LAVRLRLRVRRGDRSVDTVALLNSRYEAPTPSYWYPYPLLGSSGSGLRRTRLSWSSIP